MRVFHMNYRTKEATKVVQTGIKLLTGGLTDHSPRIKSLATSDCWEPTAWPIRLDDVTPLEWWRTMPANHLGEGPQRVLCEMLDKVSLVKRRQWLSALCGDAAASIAVAIEAMPINRITLEVDLMMTALMVCALNGNAGAVLILAHILHRAPLDHPFAQELSTSWLALNLRRARHMQKRPIAVGSESAGPGVENAGPIFHGGMQA
jgi:hypothetical protein